MRLLFSNQRISVFSNTFRSGSFPLHANAWRINGWRHLNGWVHWTLDNGIFILSLVFISIWYCTVRSTECGFSSTVGPTLKITIIYGVAPCIPYCLPVAKLIGNPQTRAKGTGLLRVEKYNPDPYPTVPYPWPAQVSKPVIIPTAATSLQHQECAHDASTEKGAG